MIEKVFNPVAKLKGGVQFSLTYDHSINFWINHFWGKDAVLSTIPLFLLYYTNMKQTLYDYCYVCDRHCGAPSFQAVAFAISLPGTLKLTRVTQQISKKIPIVSLKAEVDNCEHRSWNLSTSEWQRALKKIKGTKTKKVQFCPFLHYARRVI